MTVLFPDEWTLMQRKCSNGETFGLRMQRRLLSAHQQLIEEYAVLLRDGQDGVIAKVIAERDDLYAQADIAQAELVEWKDKYRDLETQLMVERRKVADLTPKVPSFWMGAS